MNYLCIIVSVAPLRKEPSHSSEMISQLLFGECVTILEIESDFFKVSSLFDNYVGWCSKKQLIQVNENFCATNHTKVISNCTTVAKYNGYNIVLPSGSFVGELQENLLKIGTLDFNFNNINLSEKIGLEQILFSYINTPYLWGGKSNFGIDCSGFTQQVYKILGHQLFRDAYEQATMGSLIGFLQEAKMGDLAFFDNNEGKIIHVGILLNEYEIIHASGFVKIDNIDNAGIINKETKERTHQLRLIKRII